MVTALDAAEERVKGIEAGADDFLAKPINQPELHARVRSLLRIRALYETVRRQTEELAEWNRKLEQRVAEQGEELARMDRLKRFFSPQVAELISGDGGELLQPHRRRVTVVFADLRGFTHFAETAEPEEVMQVLREFHAAVGRVISDYEGTLERFTGDGLMIFFNDPVEIPDAEERAIRLAIAMRDAARALREQWSRLGFELDLGIGITSGFATLGAVGFEGRWDYAAIGTVTNLAARLCGEAKGGQILVSERLLATVDSLVETEYAGDFSLKGLSRPVATHNVVAMREAEDPAS
jgi:class 3 adenylate cyclase